MVQGLVVNVEEIYEVIEIDQSSIPDELIYKENTELRKEFSTTR